MGSNKIIRHIGERSLTKEGYWVTVIEYNGVRNCAVQFDDGTIVKNRNYSQVVKRNIKKPTNRIGEKHITNEGYTIEIIQYFKYINCTIQFEDKTIIKNTNYGSILAKNIRKPYNRVGEKFTTNEGYEVEIISYRSATDIDIRFEDGTILRNKNYDHLQRGTVMNPNHISVCGVGYFGFGKYKSRNNNKQVKVYTVWRSMLQRCYNEKELIKYPTYKEASVCKEWHNFQNFAEWFENNYIEGFHLDKDILLKSNMSYSPETCCFVPVEINSLFTKTNSKRGECPIGVSKIKRGYTAKLTKNKMHVHLGTFKTVEEAFRAYKTAKEQHIKEVADKWRDKIEDKVYQAMYNYQVEITD